MTIPTTTFVIEEPWVPYLTSIIPDAALGAFRDNDYVDADLFWKQFKASSNCSQIIISVAHATDDGEHGAEIRAGSPGSPVTVVYWFVGGLDLLAHGLQSASTTVPRPADSDGFWEEFIWGLEQFKGPVRIKVTSVHKP